MGTTNLTNCPKNTNTHILSHFSCNAVCTLFSTGMQTKTWNRKRILLTHVWRQL